MKKLKKKGGLFISSPFFLFEKEGGAGPEVFDGRNRRGWSILPL